MIHFFTDPYEDELLYSAIGRYHFYTGNIDFKDTLVELFNKRTIVASFEIGTNIEALAKNLGGKYTADYIINEHTIYPFYIPFLPKKRKAEIIKAIKNDGGSKIYTEIGMIAGGICEKKGIYYCPCCTKKEIENYGEAYIHREHQLQGVFVCPKDGFRLKLYAKSKKNCSRIEYLIFDSRLLDFDNKPYEGEKHDKLLWLSQAAYFLLKENLTGISKENIAKAYKNLLYEKGLTTSSGRVKQRELYEEFASFYSKEFLELMESSIDFDDEYNWLKVATRNDKRVVHPIRQLMLINFLQEDISQFFKTINSKYNPFGKGPWPCLNRAAEHYRQKVVNNVKITEDYKTRVPVGTFTCSCGFIYSRKGPDKCDKDRYRVGRIKNFGDTWENKLRTLLSDGICNINQISKAMGCDAKTVVKYGEKLGVIPLTNISNSDINLKLKGEEEKIDYESIYKKDVLNFIAENKNCTRKSLRSNLKKQYTWLYRHDKAWLMTKLPNSIAKDKRNINHKSKVNWSNRDIEVLNLITKQIETMFKEAIPIRITKASVGKAVGLLATLEKNINKLPKTQKYLKEMQETVEQFQLRRCKKIIDEKLKQEEVIKLWQIQRQAGIRTEAFKKLKEELTIYITMGEKKYGKNSNEGEKLAF
jgi:hypothetical protein